MTPDQMRAVAVLSDLVGSATLARRGSLMRTQAEPGWSDADQGAVAVIDTGTGQTYEIMVRKR